VVSTQVIRFSEEFKDFIDKEHPEFKEEHGEYIDFVSVTGVRSARPILGESLGSLRSALTTPPFSSFVSTLRATSESASSPPTSTSTLRTPT
jgi:hypothetical protein